MRISLPLVLLALFPPAAGAGVEWRTSLAEAQNEARRAGKPMLVLLARGGDAASNRVERLVAGGGDIEELRSSFVCVKPSEKERDDLVDRYDVKSLPAVLFLSSRGLPVKLAGGVLTPARFAEAMRQVIERNRDLLNPKPRAPAPPPAPAPRAEREYPHSATCPSECPSCSPAIERALAWLAARQKGDGRFAKLAEECVTETPDGRQLTRSIDHVETALTALAGLAFLASGNETWRDEAARAAKFLERAVRADGIVCAEEGNDYLFLTQCNFETPLAAMLLAEWQRIAPEPVRAEKLALIVRYLERVQDAKCGAWGYSHDFNETPTDVKRGWRLLATTTCAMAGLLWARDAGVTVSPETIARGVRYVRSCAGRDGLFTYRSEHRLMDGVAGTSAGALVALARAGTVPAADLARIRRTWRPRFAGFDDYGKHWYYLLFLTALAMNDEGEDGARAFHERMRDTLLSAAEEDGSFPEDSGSGGKVLGTACAAFALSIARGKLPIASTRPACPWPAPPEAPRYVPPPHPTCRVKVFESGGAYRYDLVVSTDGPADAEWFARMGRGLSAANRILFDATDGQLALSRAVLTGGGKRWDEADIRVVTDFYAVAPLPQPFVHGVTMVSSRTTFRGSKEKEGPRIGDWVMLPWAGRGGGEPYPWDDPRLVRVIAHELAHYVLGLLDEYDTGSGGTRCPCLLGDLRSTELCRDDTHSDPDSPESCWAHAKALWPRLSVPRAEDPGPWDPPPPRIEVE